MQIVRNRRAVIGAFEELPALLVILVAVSLFSVSLAKSAVSMDQKRDLQELQEDCLVFANMIRGSETLCCGNSPGTFDISALGNSSMHGFLNEFNSTVLGFDYMVAIRVLDSSNTTVFRSSDTGSGDMASFRTCVNVLDGDRITAAKISLTIWRVQL